MTKPSPLLRVREEHGSKQKLAEKVLGFLECPEEEAQEVFEARIHSMSNRKLLRLYAANETLDSKYGSRDALVEKIVNARFPGGNDDYATKLSGFSTPRLLDLGRQHGV